MPRYACVSKADRLVASAAAPPLPPPPPSPFKPTRGHVRKALRCAGGKKTYCQRCARRSARRPLGEVGHEKCDYCAKQRNACAWWVLSDYVAFRSLIRHVQVPPRLERAVDELIARSESANQDLLLKQT
jgi:hypothetical protein